MPFLRFTRKDSGGVSGNNRGSGTRPLPRLADLGTSSSHDGTSQEMHDSRNAARLSEKERPLSEDEDIPTDDPPPYSETPAPASYTSAPPRLKTPLPKEAVSSPLTDLSLDSKPSILSSSSLTPEHQSFLSSLLEIDILPELHTTILTRTPVITLLLLHSSTIPPLVPKTLIPTSSLSWIPGPSKPSADTWYTSNAVHSPTSGFVVDAPRSENLHTLHLTSPSADEETLTKEWFYTQLGALIKEYLSSENWSTDLSCLQSSEYPSQASQSKTAPSPASSKWAPPRRVKATEEKLPYTDFWPFPKEGRAKVVVGPREVTVRYEDEWGLWQNLAGVGLKVRVEFGFGEVERTR